MPSTMNCGFSSHCVLVVEANVGAPGSVCKDYTTIILLEDTMISGVGRRFPGYDRFRVELDCKEG